MTQRRTAYTLGLVTVIGLAGCRGSMHLTTNDADIVLAHQVLDAPNPGLPGSFQVRTLYYGSGTDRRPGVSRFGDDDDGNRRCVEAG